MVADCVLNTREESVLKDIQPDELHVKMQDPCFFEEVQLIDVREPEEVYACISYILNKWPENFNMEFQVFVLQVNEMCFQVNRMFRVCLIGLHMKSCIS